MRRHLLAASLLLGLLAPSDAAQAKDHPAIITYMQWLEQPTASVANSAAENSIPPGRYAAECDIEPSGLVHACEPSALTHEAWSAIQRTEAVRFAWSLHGQSMVPTTYDGLPLWSRVRITVVVLGDGPDRQIVLEDPECVQCIYQDGDESISRLRAGVPLRDLPPEAERQGISEGQVLLRCRNDGSGALSECSIWHETPLGSGFGREALAAAADGRLRTRSGYPGLTAFIAYFRVTSAEEP